MTTLKKVIEEIKTIVHKEDFLMELKNKLSLSDLLTRKPSDKEYQEVVELLAQLAKETYEEFKFLFAKSPDETDQPHFLQIISNSTEKPELHKLIFAKGLEYGLDMKELQKRFAQYVAENNVIELGEDVVVITDDGTNQPPTGVSPINNGLEGGEICFIVSFMKKENYPKWAEKTFKKEEKAHE